MRAHALASSPSTPTRRRQVNDAVGDDGDHPGRQTEGDARFKLVNVTSAMVNFATVESILAVGAWPAAKDRARALADVSPFSVAPPFLDQIAGAPVSLGEGRDKPANIARRTSPARRRSAAPVAISSRPRGVPTYM